MRLLPYILLGYLAVGMQVGLGGFVHFAGAAPNIVLIVAIFFALFAGRETALLACFTLGLMQDLLTQQSLGLFALAYGTVALAVSHLAPMVYRQNPLTHAGLALGGSLVTSFLLLVHGWIFGGGPGVGGTLLTAVLTAVLSPALMVPLMKLRPLLGMRVARKWT